MASISPSSEISSVVRGKQFTRTISATPSVGETIVSVTATLNDEKEIGISITPGTSQVTISGKYLTGFTDSASYISKGSSDQLETPIVVSNLSDIPKGKELFKYEQDPISSITKDYTVIVSLQGGNSSEYSLTHEVKNDISTGTNFVYTYFDATRSPLEFPIVWNNNFGNNLTWLNSAGASVEWSDE
jgi:hypothetical protein